MTPAEFKARTRETTSGCWMWTLRLDRKGYGRVSPAGKPGLLAHRVAYELFRGPIPAGLTVDHICFNPACVNPGHLQLLTHSENSGRQRRAYEAACVNGHEYTPENTYRPARGGRHCRACGRRRSAEYSARRKAAA